MKKATNTQAKKETAMVVTNEATATTRKEGNEAMTTTKREKYKPMLYATMYQTRNGKLTAKALKLQQEKIAYHNALMTRFFEAVRKDKESKITKYDRCEDDITEATIWQMSIAITVKALRTNLSRSGHGFIEKMYIDAVRYARKIERYIHEGETYSLKNWIPTYHKELNDNEANDLNKPSIANCDVWDDLAQDGADLVQDTATYLSQYLGAKLTDKVTDGRKNKQGETVNILTGAFYNLRAIIYGHEKREFKCQYLDDYDEEGEILRVPFMWDVPQKSQLERIYELMKLLDLTPVQANVLWLRMRNLSLAQIGDIKGCSKQAVAYTLKQVQAKALKLFDGNTIDNIRAKFGSVEVDEYDIEY